MQGFFLRGAEQGDVQQRVALAEAGDGGQQRAVVDVRHNGHAQAAFQPLGQLQGMHLQQPQLFGNQPGVWLQGQGLCGRPDLA
ncbi:hypothetical protein D3C85_1684920 [compost metagenome]